MKLTDLPKSEKSIQDDLRDYLTLTLGALVIRTNSGAFKGDRGNYFRANDQPGCSDLIVCLRGSFIACECKKKGGRLTDKQAAFLDRVRRAGGLGIVVDSKAALISALRAAGLI